MKFQFQLTFDTFEEAQTVLQKLGLTQAQVQTVSQPAQQPTQPQPTQQHPPTQPYPNQPQYGQQPMTGPIQGVQPQYGQQPMTGPMQGVQPQYGQQPMPGPAPGVQPQYGQQPMPGPMQGVQPQYGQQPMPGQNPGAPTIELVADLARTAASKGRSNELMALCQEFSIPKLTDCPEATRPMLVQRLQQLAN